MSVATDFDEPEKPHLTPAPWFMSSRLGLALISFFVLMSMTSQRASMYVAIPCMVNQSALDREMGIIVINGTKIMPTPDPNLKRGISQKSQANSLKEKKCNSTVIGISPQINLAPSKDGEFVWTHDEQLVIYKTFYWGYLVAQVPAGWFASRFGSRTILAGFLMLASLSTIMVPLSTSVHYFILLVVRFVGGVGAGAVFPSIVALWAKWAPPGERSRLLTIGFSGSTVGLVLSYPVAGFLCRYGFDGGWRSIFYTFGGLGCIASIIWFMFVSDSPLTHRRISKEEKIYIVTSLSGETDIEPNKEEFNVPWYDLLTSLPFLSLAVCHFTCEWALYTFETKAPLFMKTILKFDVQKDPVIWLLPYIGLWIVVLVSGVWADKLRTRAVVSTSIVRKLMQCIGTLVPAAFLVALGFMDCTNVPAAIGIDVLGIAFIGFQYSGFLVNHLDIYPKYAGVAIGLCNSVGAVSELVAPMLIEVIMETKEQGNWQMMFMITACFLGFSALCFLACGTGDLQPWAACEEFDLEDLSSDESSDYESNNGPSTPSEDSNDIISGETKTIPKKRKESLSADPNRKKIYLSGRSPAEHRRKRSTNLERAPELPEYATPTHADQTARENPSRGQAKPVPTPPSMHPVDSASTLTKYDDVANLLSQYDTLPARGRARSVSPSPEKQGFRPYIGTFSPPISGYYSNSLDRPIPRSRTGSSSPYPVYPGMDSSLPHSITSDEPYDSVGGGSMPYTVRSRHASPVSPAFGSYASLQNPPSPSAFANAQPLSRRPSRSSSRGVPGTPQLPPRTSLTSLEASPSSRQHSLTPTSTFPQPESGYKRPSIDSTAALEHLEESIV